MNKATYWVGILPILFGLIACSINAGSGSAGEPVSKATTPTVTESNEGDSASTPNTNSNASTNSGTTNKSNTTNNQSSVNPAGSGSNTNSPTINNNQNYITPASQAYKYLTDETAKQSLLNTIATMPNLSGPCNNSSTSPCSATVASGTIIAAYKQSYSNYAVIRENYDKDNRTAPANSFINVVTQYTPESQQSAALNATYKGQASYSRSNGANVVTRNDLTLTTTGSSIQGVLNAEPTMSGVIHPVITFNAGAINVADGKVSFSGTALFHSRFFNSASAAGGGQDLTGRYNGVFAGNNAEEAIGTFETTNYTDEKSVQGAFAAKKQ